MSYLLPSCQRREEEFIVFTEEPALENRIEAIMQITAEMDTAFVVPREWDSIPIRKFPIGAKPRNTSE